MEETLADIESLHELGADFTQIIRHIAVDIVEHIRIFFDDFQHGFFVHQSSIEKDIPVCIGQAIIRDDLSVDEFLENVGFIRVLHVEKVPEFLFGSDFVCIRRTDTGIRLDADRKSVFVA